VTLFCGLREYLLRIALSTHTSGVHLCCNYQVHCWIKNIFCLSYITCLLVVCCIWKRHNKAGGRSWVCFILPYSTHGATVAATTLIQCFYSAFYSRNIVQRGFKFKFELFLNFPIEVLFTTCKGTLKFWIQVSQSKFTILKIMSRKIFGKSMEFFLKGLSPFLNSNQIQLCFAS
jgi:hypothetical protein